MNSQSGLQEQYKFGSSAEQENVRGQQLHELT
jgi:hypothetical protein